MEHTRASERDLNLSNADKLESGDWKKENGIYTPPTKDTAEVVLVKFQMKMEIA